MSAASVISKAKKLDANEKQKQADQVQKLAEQFIHEEFQAAAAPKRGRGRPPKSASNKSTPEPERKKSNPTPEDVVHDLRKRKCVRKLRAMHQLFPEELGPSLDAFDYASADVEQIEKVIEACQYALEDDIEIHFYPRLLLDSLNQVEAAGAAVAAMNPGHKYLRYGGLLNHFGDWARHDPNVVKDIKLISLDMLGMLPSSPFLRLTASLLYAGYKCIQFNLQARTVAEHQAENPDGKYQNL